MTNLKPYFALCYQALDKIRFLSLTDNSILGESDQAKLEILVRLINFSNNGSRINPPRSV